jgi:hypothetical protein
MGGVKTISIIVAANIKGLEASLGKANKSIAGFASQAARVGSMLSFGVTAPLAAMGKQAFDTFSKFENSMMKVNTVTGASVEEFKMLTSEAKRLGATTQFTASQVAELQLVLGRKGFDPTQIQNMEQSILDLALATGEDLSLAADTVASSINAFGLASDDASSVANTLASAAANSSIQLSTFSTAFGHAGASAKAVGVDIDELSAMMGVLMDNGIKASKAGTGLRKAFMELNEQGRPFGETLEQLSNGTMTLNQAQKMVGKTGANQLLILSQNKDKLAELTNEYKTNTGRLDEMAEAMGNTAFAKVKKMQSAIEGLQLEMGALLADMILPLIQKITQIANKFSALDEETQKSIIKFAAVAAAIGPVLIAVGALVGVFGNLLISLKKVATTGLSLLFNPMGAVLGLTTALAAGIIYLSENWDAFIVSVAKSAKPIRNIVTGLMSAVGKALGPGLGTKLQVNAVLIEELGKAIDSGLTPPPDKKWKSFGDTMKDVISDVLGFDLSALTDLFNTGQKDEFEFIGLDKAFDELQDLYDELEEEDLFGSAKSSLQEFGEKLDVGVQKWAGKIGGFFDKWGEGIGIVGDIWGQALQNKTIALDNFHKKELDAINNSQMTEEQKEAAIQNLEEDTADKRAKIQRKQAIADKAAAIAAATINGAQAITKVAGQTGIGAIAAAPMIAGLVAAQIAMIAAQPIPAFADGGIVSGPTLGLMGEYSGAKANPEVIAPLDKLKSIIGGSESQTIIPDVRISGDDLLIVFDRANRRKARR